MRLKDLAVQFSNSLSSTYGKQEADAIFLLVIDQLLKYTRSDYLRNKEEVIPEHQLKELLDTESQLITGRPLQYVLGETIFYGLPFKVNPAVLIPRPETEELVEWVLEQAMLTEISGGAMRIIDIGTGSGCIAVSLKKNLPHSEVTALDVSTEALATAASNATLNQVEVNFIHADIRAFTTAQKFDVIVSNPPYITMDEQQAMHENVLSHEPHLALFVANERPLEFYEVIADFAWKNLSDFGYLFFEINEHLGKETIEMLTIKSFINITLKKDMQGKDRMICCQKRII